MIGMNIGVDFGSSSTIMVVDGKGIVLDEPTVIAVDSETKYPIAFGNNAYTIEGRTDDNIEVIHPVVNGVISNYTMAQKLLGHYLLKNLRQQGFEAECYNCSPECLYKP